MDIVRTVDDCKRQVPTIIVTGIPELKLDDHSDSSVIMEKPIDFKALMFLIENSLAAPRS